MSYERRLPIYLVLDCSESMAGPALESVARGVDALVNQLRGDPQALESAYLSVITFARQAKQDVPLTEIGRFVPPRLVARTGTALGAALKLLLESIRREVIRTTPTTKGDFKPLVFLLTDGQPTDAWQGPADALRRANDPKIANIYAIGCGPDVDPDMLRKLTDTVLMLDELTPEAFKRFFLWLSASVQTASQALLAPGPINMPALPASLALAPPSTFFDSTPRQVFLHARCRRDGRPYLMRFLRQGNTGRYEAVAAHPLELIEEDAGDYLPPISSSQLMGCPPCPYCKNPIAGHCDCGTSFCLEPNPPRELSCPGCRGVLTLGGDGGAFDIKRAQG